MCSVCNMEEEEEREEEAEAVGHRQRGERRRPRIRPAATEASTGAYTQTKSGSRFLHALHPRRHLLVAFTPLRVGVGFYLSFYCPGIRCREFGACRSIVLFFASDKTWAASRPRSDSTFPKSQCSARRVASYFHLKRTFQTYRPASQACFASRRLRPRSTRIRPPSPRPLSTLFPSSEHLILLLRYTSFSPDAIPSSALRRTSRSRPIPPARRSLSFSTLLQLATGSPRAVLFLPSPASPIGTNRIRKITRSSIMKTNLCPKTRSNLYSSIIIRTTITKVPIISQCSRPLSRIPT